ncbi:cytochrome P450 3A24-like [Apostichopus japonicus]|uniref:cytochrome P450 3A24-like n=1 Tax=Stichopus japonicus TaxID=307972 RepID=UPI003AB2FD81
MAIYELLFNSTTLTLLGSIVAVYLAVDYWKMLYFVRNGIPAPLPIPVFGTMFSYTKGLTFDLVEKRRKYGKIYGMYVGQACIAVNDVDVLQAVLISRFSSLSNRSKLPYKDAPFDKAVSNAQDGHWKSVRNTVSPAFSGNKLKQMNPLINECCDRLVRNIHKQMENQGFIQCKDLFGSYSMEVVASVFFGLQVDCQSNPDDPFTKHASEAFRNAFVTMKAILPFLVPGLGKLYDLLGVSVTDPKIKRFFLGVIAKALELREKGEVKRMDILQLMADAHHLDSSKEDQTTEDPLVHEGTASGSSQRKAALTTEEIMANAYVFFLAGYETTNTALCLTSYLLATHPEKQDKLFEEVKKFAPRREDVTYKVLSQMEYLDCFVRESLRLFPPISVLDRINDKSDIVIKDLLIPKGFRIFVPVYAIHHDPEIWEDPEEFQPERFNKENRGKIHPASWLPFGDGPRNCIGMRLAMMEIKFGIIRVLQEYKLKTCSETEIPPVLNARSPFLCPKNGVKLQLVTRETTDSNM